MLTVSNMSLIRLIPESKNIKVNKTALKWIICQRIEETAEIIQITFYINIYADTKPKEYQI